MDNNPICPRCHNFIPNNTNPGAYPGAMSRTDNQTEICSKCGTDEAVQAVLKIGPTPKDQWPVKWHHLTPGVHFYI